MSTSVARVEEIRRRGQLLLEQYNYVARRKLVLVQVGDPEFRRLFDRALDVIHYAGSCQRVGRCLRLAIVSDGLWAGGIVLGSTFPNIDSRDRFLGLKKYIVGFRNRGLRSPWARENRPYWTKLQRVVNHARTFVFPKFQGQGIGVRAHRLLLKEGVRLWEARYGDRVAAIDTLCDDGDSKLFLKNGWTLVGETKGFHSHIGAPFSRRSNRRRPLKNNVALVRDRRSRKWVIWVRILDAASI